MNQTGHELLQRWARDRRSYVQSFDLGYGGTIEQRILEGKGTLMPGAPKGGGRKKTDIDPVAHKIDKFISTLSGKERKILQVWYIKAHLTVEEKSTELSMARRTLYIVLEKCQEKVVQHIYPEVPND